MNVRYDRNEKLFIVRLTENDAGESIHLPLEIAVLLTDYYAEQENRETITNGSYNLACGLHEYGQALKDRKPETKEGERGMTSVSGEFEEELKKL